LLNDLEDRHIANILRIHQTNQHDEAATSVDAVSINHPEQLPDSTTSSSAVPEDNPLQNDQITVSEIGDESSSKANESGSGSSGAKTSSGEVSSLGEVSHAELYTNLSEGEVEAFQKKERRAQAPATENYITSSSDISEIDQIDSQLKHPGSSQQLDSALNKNIQSSSNDIRPFHSSQTLSAVLMSEQHETSNVAANLQPASSQEGRNSNSILLELDTLNLVQESQPVPTYSQSLPSISQPLPLIPQPAPSNPQLAPAIPHSLSVDSEPVAADPQSDDEEISTENQNVELDKVIEKTADALAEEIIGNALLSIESSNTNNSQSISKSSEHGKSSSVIEISKSSEHEATSDIVEISQVSEHFIEVDSLSPINSSSRIHNNAPSIQPASDEDKSSNISSVHPPNSGDESYNITSLMEQDPHELLAQLSELSNVSGAILSTTDSFSNHSGNRENNEVSGDELSKSSTRSSQLIIPPVELDDLIPDNHTEEEEGVGKNEEGPKLLEKNTVHISKKSSSSSSSTLGLSHMFLNEEEKLDKFFD
jgi:hypothetical protein